MASSGGDRDGIWAQNGAKRPFKDKKRDFVGLLVFSMCLPLRVCLCVAKKGAF